MQKRCKSYLPLKMGYKSPAPNKEIKKCRVNTQELNDSAQAFMPVQVTHFSFLLIICFCEKYFAPAKD
jgi:hypothetical protein